MRRAVFLAASVLGIALLIAAGSLAWWAPFAWAFFLIAVIAALIWLQSGEQQGLGEEG